MNLDEQYELFVESLTGAIDEAMDQIPGETVEGNAICAALGYVLYTLACASENPERVVHEFLARAAGASSAMLAMRGEN